MDAFDGAVDNACHILGYTPQVDGTQPLDASAPERRHRRLRHDSNSGSDNEAEAQRRVVFPANKLEPTAKPKPVVADPLDFLAAVDNDEEDDEEEENDGGDDDDDNETADDDGDGEDGAAEARYSSSDMEENLIKAGPADRKSNEKKRKTKYADFTVSSCVRNL